MLLLAMYYLGMIFTVLTSCAAVVIALSLTELMGNRRHQRVYLLCLLGMIICIATFFYL